MTHRVPQVAGEGAPPGRLGPRLRQGPPAVEEGGKGGAGQSSQPPGVAQWVKFEFGGHF